MAAITDLTTLAAADVADADWLVIHDLTAGTDKKVARSDLFSQWLGGEADGTVNGRIRIRNIDSLADAGLVSLVTLFDGSTTLNGILVVINATVAYAGIFVLRGGINAVVEALDPSSQFSTTAGTTGTNIIYSGGYYLENKAGSARSYNLLFFGTVG